MVRVSPKSANLPNEMALTVCNPISRYCFRLMRDWKLENVLNGKEISVVPFRMEKEEYLLRYFTISERNFRKITSPFDFKPKFPDFFWLNSKHPWFGFSLLDESKYPSVDYSRDINILPVISRACIWLAWVALGWFSKNSASRAIFVEFHGSRSLVV